MATLSVSGAQDYRSRTGELANITTIQFASGPNGSAIFNASQFAPGLISTSVHVVSDSFVNHQITVHMQVTGPTTTFSAANWTYSSTWGFFLAEYLAINGTIGNDVITGSVGRDIVTVGGGIDVVDGGDGYDTLVADYSAITDGLLIVLSYDAITSRNGTVQTVSVNQAPVTLLDATRFENFHLKSGTQRDVISLIGVGNIVDSGAGNDELSMNNGTFNGGSGSDELGVTGFAATQTGAMSITFTSGSDAAGWTGTVSDGGTIDVDFQNTESFELWSRGNYNDTFITRGGDDSFTLIGGGTDVVDGRGGHDRLDFVQEAGAGVTANVTGTGSAGGEGYRGTLTSPTGAWNVSFDHINELWFTLSGANDTLNLGNEDDTVFFMANGNDIVNAGGGYDRGFFSFESNTTATIAGAVTGDGYSGTISASGGRSVQFSNVNDVTITSDETTTDTVNMTMRNAPGLFEWQTFVSSSVKTLNLDYSAATRALTGTFYDMGGGEYVSYIEVLETDGTSLSYAAYYNIDVINMTLGSGNDVIAIDLGKDTISGGIGNDSLATGRGNDVLNGDAGNDTLNGQQGLDSLAGGANDDTYIIDRTVDGAALDTVTEAANAGIDTVRYTAIAGYLGYTLGANVENLTLLGALNANGTGNTLANTITGNAGINVLNGLGGADSMTGNAGNDQYHVDNTGDVVVEGAGQGTADRVLASVSYVLGAAAQVELFTTTNAAGTGAINLTGNGFAQTIAGNAGNNIIDGKGGADNMQGFAGNDWYYVDNTGDVVLDGAGQGTADRVFASVSIVLTAGAEIEILSTTNGAGTAAINFTGNGFSQSIGGNAGNNVIYGGGGNDSMVGFGGNDSYFVDSAGDSVLEQVGGGNDRVSSSISYTLTSGQEIELFTTTNVGGTDAIDLTGNNLAQSIGGNAGNNVLNGGAGIDVLTGFAGLDTFFFNTALGASNVDRIADFSVADDTIRLENAIFAGLAAGALVSGAFNTGAAATQADDRIVYNAATGALIFDADGLNGNAGIQFATLNGGLALTAGDFAVV